MTPFDLARRFEGLSEIPGQGSRHLILAMLEIAGVETVYDSTPWCGAFVSFIAWLVDLPRPDHPARARSWLTVGRPVALASAEIGHDVVILSRGGDDQPGPEVLDAPGHVGFFAGRSATGDLVLVLGGNQGDAVGIASYPVSRVLGVRRLEARPS